MKAIRTGGNREGPQSYESVANDWFKRHIDARGVISAKAKRRTLENHILPEWGGRDFESIKRVDVALLLDRVEDKAGQCAADNVLNVIRSIGNWYATRNDEYTSPIIRGMRRSNSKERERSRILSDDEIRSVWKAAEGNGTFGALVRLLLLLR